MKVVIQSTTQDRKRRPPTVLSIFVNLVTLIVTLLTALHHFSCNVRVGGHASYATTTKSRVFALNLWQYKVVTVLFYYTLLDCYSSFNLLLIISNNTIAFSNAYIMYVLRSFIQCNIVTNVFYDFHQSLINHISSLNVFILIT